MSGRTVLAAGLESSVEELSAAEVRPAAFLWRTTLNKFACA